MLEASRWIGSLTPGRAADILVVDNLTQFTISRVYCDGVQVALDDQLSHPVSGFVYPEWALNTVHLDLLTPLDFQIIAPSNGPVQVRVIQLVPDRVNTLLKTATLEPRNRCVNADPGQDLAKAGVFYRHSPMGLPINPGDWGLSVGQDFWPGPRMPPRFPMTVIICWWWAPMMRPWRWPPTP